MKRILVLGESCRDVFVYCSAERLAPDVPIPVLNVLEQRENPGMAANVERNMKRIFTNVDLYTNDDWEKETKTRYVHRDTNHMFIRVDTARRLSQAKIRNVPLLHYDAIAISDYDKGFLTEEDIQYVCERHGTVFVDTKKILGDWIVKAKYIKINYPEYTRSKPYVSKIIENKIIYTRGEQGAFFNGKNYPVRKKVEVRDLSGAGDTFFAALVVRYVQTEDIRKSISFANECASEVVKHKGVAVIQKY